MSKIILEITMSLDGYIAGRDISVTQPLGKDGERLHDWLFAAKTDQDVAIAKEMIDRSGAVIAGWHTYETAIEDAWGGESPFEAPVFVLAEKVPENPVQGFTFVTDGLESALEQARKAAGDRDVLIMGGANIAQQYVKAGLVDELYIHIAPLLMCEGTRLFDNIGSELIALENFSAVQTPAATHLKYHVKK